MMGIDRYPRPWTIGVFEEGFWGDDERHPIDDSILDAEGQPVIWFEDGIDSDGTDMMPRCEHIVHCVNAHDELMAALRESLDFLLYADFDFRNGVEHMGIDEGEVWGTRVLAELVEKLKGVLAKEDA